MNSCGCVSAAAADPGAPGFSVIVVDSPDDASPLKEFCLFLSSSIASSSSCGLALSAAADAWKPRISGPSPNHACDAAKPVAGAFFHPPVPAVAATRQSPTDAYPRHSVPRAVHRAEAPPRTHPGALARPLETTDAMRGSIAIRLGSPKPGALRPCAAASVGRWDSTREFRRRD